MAPRSPSQSDSSPSKNSPTKKSPYVRRDANSKNIFVNDMSPLSAPYISQMVNHVYEDFTSDEFVLQTQLSLDQKPQDFVEDIASAVDKFPSARAVLAPDADLLTMFTCFETATQAQQYAQSIIPKVSETDESLPQTKNQKRALVSVLTRAFKSTAHATDNEKELLRFRKQAHDIRLVEQVCWELVEACIKRSIMGPLCNGYSTDRVGSARYQMRFVERFDALVETMVMYKGSCNALFKPKYKDEFVDNPYFHLNRSVSNRMTNSKRAREIEAGKAVLTPRRTDVTAELSPLLSKRLRLGEENETQETTSGYDEELTFASSIDDPFL